MKTPTKTSLTFVLATSALAFMSLTAQASASDVLTRTVSYADLNLDSSAGAKVLYKRLRAAAETVCHPLQGRSLREIADYQGCFDKAVASAVVSINKPSLSALYSQVHHDTTG